MGSMDNYYCGLLKLASLTVFHGSFLLFVTFDINLCLGNTFVGHIALILSFTHSSDFVSPISFSTCAKLEA